MLVNDNVFLIICYANSANWIINELMNGFPVKQIHYADCQC